MDTDSARQIRLTAMDFAVKTQRDQWEAPEAIVARAKLFEEFMVNGASPIPTPKLKAA